MQQVELLFAFAGQHPRLGQARVELGLFGAHACIAIGLMAHVDLGPGHFVFGQLQLCHFIGRTDGLGLRQRLLGQAQLFIGSRVIGASGQGQQRQGGE
ncbi:hypothetical protein D3C77_570040 [compost metagenome]